MPTTPNLLVTAQQAMQEERWSEAAYCFGLSAQRDGSNAAVWHNLSICQFALGKAQEAINSCEHTQALDPLLWQSKLIEGRSYKQLNQMDLADECFDKVLQVAPDNSHARNAKADLALNVFGAPLEAIEWVKPLLNTPRHAQDALLTTLMASLYDRDIPAAKLNRQVISFSRDHLRLYQPKKEFTKTTRIRDRIALLSPLFCVSPVYFLTIHAWKRLAERSDIIVFNRGHKSDWATQIFKTLSVEWHDVQELSADRLAQELYKADIDVLYDLGGWMDPVGLTALSVKPARLMFKWVGGQSVTTGLDTFDGWMGDVAQTPFRLQHLYTEPVINAPHGYAIYTPPPYLPSPSKFKRDTPVIYSNPAKISRAFLDFLKTYYKGPLCFVHHQFKYLKTRTRIEEALGVDNVAFLCPTTHQEALEILGQHKTMIDTFPYSSGLTAREAKAMGVHVHAPEAPYGTLFCERHTAPL